MSISLSECLLGRYRPRTKQGASSASPPQRATQEGSGATAPVEYSAQVSELRRLLGEIAGGWTELVTSIQELKDALQPEDLRTTLEALGLDESILPQKVEVGSPAARGIVESSPTDEAAANPPGTPPDSDEAQERLETLLRLVRDKLTSIESATSESPDAQGSGDPEPSNHAT